MLKHLLLPELSSTINSEMRWSMFERWIQARSRFVVADSLVLHDMAIFLKKARSLLNFLGLYH